MPNSNSNLYLGLIAFVFVVAIAWCLWPCGSTKADRDPVMLTKEKEPVELARVDAKKLSKDFFVNGLGFMANMDRNAMEEAFRQNMTINTGGGVFNLSKIQIAEEISRIIDDKTSVGTEFRDEETPAFDPSAGYNNQAVGEVSHVTVKPTAGPNKGKICKKNLQTGELESCKAVELASSGAAQ